MCIHSMNQHSCGHFTPNLDHTLNHHCTNVQTQLLNFNDQRNVKLIPGAQQWPKPAPTICPISWPTIPLIRDWQHPIPEHKVRGWTGFKDDETDLFLRKDDGTRRRRRIRRFALSTAHPTFGDDTPNVQTIRVPWGCGTDIGRCSAGLAGKRCMEKEMAREGHCPASEWPRERKIAERLRIEGFSEGEIHAALLEERRIRHIEDVRALEFGFDPAAPIIHDPFEESNRRASRVVYWRWLDRKHNKRPFSQIWGGAMLIGSLDKFEEPEEAQCGRRLSVGTNPSRDGTFRPQMNASWQDGLPNGYPALPGLSSSRVQKSDPTSQENNGSTNNSNNTQTSTPSNTDSVAQGNSSVPTIVVSDNSPRNQTESLPWYDEPVPTHTSLGRPIIDGSSEYSEYMANGIYAGRYYPEVTHHQLTTPAQSKAWPTIITESGRLILQGSADTVEVIADEITSLIGNKEDAHWQLVDFAKLGK